MNWKEAEKLIMEGQQVRLPEWTGYWFKDDKGEIKAFLRTGDIADAWLAGSGATHLRERPDWELVIHGLGFDFAILALKAGKKLARSGWYVGEFIFLQKGYPAGIGLNKNTSEALDVPEGTVMRISPYLMKRTLSGLETGWLASQSDMLAADWQIAAY